MMIVSLSNFTIKNFRLRGDYPGIPRQKRRKADRATDPFSKLSHHRRFFASGTGSKPPRQNGWQRSSRQQMRNPPRIKPCRSSASIA
jgi:hypothetical protein